MEQIKRANNLWSSDRLSLLSRSEINIPVYPDGPTDSPNFISSEESSKSSSPRQEQHLERRHSEGPSSSSDINLQGKSSSLESDDIPLDEKSVTDSLRHQNGAKPRNGYKTNTLNDKSSQNVSDGSLLVESDEEESAADFLIRIDSSIAQTKDKVKKVMQQTKINSWSEEDLNGYRNSRRHRSALRRNNSSTSTRSTISNNSSCDLVELPQPLIMTQGKKVFSSLKRLEMKQDELYEL